MTLTSASISSPSVGVGIGPSALRSAGRPAVLAAAALIASSLLSLALGAAVPLVAAQNGAALLLLLLSLLQSRSAPSGAVAAPGAPASGYPPSGPRGPSPHVPPRPPGPGAGHPPGGTGAPPRGMEPDPRPAVPARAAAPAGEPPREAQRPAREEARTDRPTGHGQPEAMNAQPIASPAPVLAPSVPAEPPRSAAAAVALLATGEGEAAAAAAAAQPVLAQPRTRQQALANLLEQEVLVRYEQPFAERAGEMPRMANGARFSSYQAYRAACGQTIEPRGQHGARHAARVALLSQVFWRLAHAFGPDGSAIALEGEPPLEMIVGAAFHDAGRQAEGRDLWDADSADLFADWLRRGERDADSVASARGWLADKDPRDGQYTCPEHACIHDADCLEIVRFNGPRANFRWDNLALWNLAGATEAQRHAMQQVIRRLKDEWAGFIDFVEDRIPEGSGIDQDILRAPASAYRRYGAVLVADFDHGRYAGRRWPFLGWLLRMELAEEQYALLAAAAD